MNRWSDFHSPRCTLSYFQLLSRNSFLHRRSPPTIASSWRDLTSAMGKSADRRSIELTSIDTGALVSSEPAEGSHSWNVSPDKSSATWCNHNSTTRDLSPSEYLVPLYSSHLRTCNSNFFSTQLMLPGTTSSASSSVCVLFSCSYSFSSSTALSTASFSFSVSNATLFAVFARSLAISSFIIACSTFGEFGVYGFTVSAETVSTASFLTTVPTHSTWRYYSRFSSSWQYANSDGCTRERRTGGSSCFRHLPYSLHLEHESETWHPNPLSPTARTCAKTVTNGSFQIAYFVSSICTRTVHSSLEKFKSPCSILTKKHWQEAGTR